mgnify:CR=1 FL=1
MDEKVLEKLKVLAESAKYDVSCASKMYLALPAERRERTRAAGSEVRQGGAFVIALPRMAVAFLY